MILRRGSRWVVGAVLNGVICLMGAGCSSSSSKPAQTGFQFTSPAAGAAIDQGQTVNMSVNGTANWSLQSKFGNAVGTLTASPGSTTASYTAPASVTAKTQVTVVATSTSDMTATAALSVVIEPPPQITTASPISVPCPDAGTVITTAGSPPFPHVWTVGSAAGTFPLNATGGVAPYTWMVSAGTLPAGLSIINDPLTNQPEISGTPTSGGCSSVTMQVTDAAGLTATLPYFVLVLPPPLTVQHPPLANAYVNVPYPPAALKVTGGVPPYTWTADTSPGAAFPPGLGASSPAQNPDIAVITGTPTAEGLLQVFAPGIFVHDSQLPYPAATHDQDSVLGTGQVLNEDSSCHSGSEGNLSTAKGPYAFLLRGFDANGPVVVAGNFSVDGAGGVTGGVEDINRSSGVHAGLNILASSSFTVGEDNRGCLTLVNSAGITMTFHTALGACSTVANIPPQGGCQNSGYFTKGRVLVDDPTTGVRATGIIRLQDSSVFAGLGLSGPFAFGFSGWDAAGGRYAVAGSATAGSGSFSSVAADINDAGNVGSNLSGGSGTYNIALNGRGTAAISVGSANLGFAVYVVSGTEALFASTDALDANHPMLSGEALAAPGPFTVPALQNTYMLRMAGLSSGVGDPNIGLLTFDGVTSATGTFLENNGGTLGTTAISANYTVDGTSGRLSFTAPATTQNLGPHPIVGYIAAADKGVSAFVVSSDSSAQAGILQFQNLNPPVSTFSNASLAGASFLGTDEDLNVGATNLVAAPFLNGIGGFKGLGLVADVGYPVASGVFPGPHGLAPNQQFSASYSVGKNGIGTFGGQTVSVTNGSTVFYMDESPIDLNPTITVVEQ